MLISDVHNKDEVTALIITELKDLGVKYRKEKKTKSSQVNRKRNLLIIYIKSGLCRKNAIEKGYFVCIYIF